MQTQDELVAVSEHLYYEIEMLNGTAFGLASGIAGESVLKNALLESFLLHSRILLAFLYYDNPRNDDVIAENFVSDWALNRPPESPIFKEIHFRVGKEIAHLTYKRLSVTEETKQWRFLDIAEEVSRVLHIFVRRAPDRYLGPKMTGYKRSVESACNPAVPKNSSEEGDSP